MENSIVIKIPNDLNYFDLVETTIKKLSSQVHFSKQDENAMVEATKELVENSIEHGYKEHTGFIEVSFHTFEYGLRIDVRDWGLPMSPKKQTSVPIDLEGDKGFNRVYNLTDTFEYLNLGKEGKKFTIIKYSAHPKFPEPTNPREEEKKSNNLNVKQIEVEIRHFKEGDEEAIAKLIYQNANLDFGISYSHVDTKKQHTHLQYEYDPLTEIAIITIDGYGKHFEHKFADTLQQLRAKHCHMIYADLCLEHNPKIDKIIKILEHRSFFYSGVLFLRCRNKDYLRLQNKHSDIIGKKNLKCYSDFCTSLLEFIEKDEKRVKKL